MNQPPEKLKSSAPEGTIWFGGPVDSSKLSLRVFGESMDLDKITSLLGHTPTKGRTKGKRASWHLSAPEMNGADLNSQIDWIFSRLSKDLSIWKKITEEYQVDLFCGLFLDAPNRGISLSPETMKEISSRGIELGFDIYSFEPEGADPVDGDQ